MAIRRTGPLPSLPSPGSGQANSPVLAANNNKRASTPPGLFSSGSSGNLFTNIRMQLTSEPGLVIHPQTGLIRGATLDKALQVLTEQVASAGFLYELLGCYKVFLSDTEFLQRILGKINAPDKDKDPNLQRARLINILKIWIKEYAADWNPTDLLYKQLSKYMDECRDPNITKVLASLKLSLSKTTTISTTGVGSGGLRASSASISVSSTRAATQLKNLKEVSSMELVAELTALDQELYDPILPADLTLWVSTKLEDRNTKVSRLAKFMDRNAETTGWVTTTILLEPDMQERAALITKFATMSRDAFDLGNFSLSLSILSGINHPAVATLSSTWTRVDPTVFHGKLEPVRSVSSPAGGYHALRSFLSTWKAPCIVYMGAMLDRLSSSHKMLDDLVFENEFSMINFEKYRKLQDISAELKGWKTGPIPLKSTKPNLRTVFQQLQCLDDTALAAKAKELNESSAEIPVPRNPSWMSKPKTTHIGGFVPPAAPAVVADYAEPPPSPPAAATPTPLRFPPQIVTNDDSPFEYIEPGPSAPRYTPRAPTSTPPTPTLAVERPSSPVTRPITPPPQRPPTLPPGAVPTASPRPSPPPDYINLPAKVAGTGPPITTPLNPTIPYIAPTVVHGSGGHLPFVRPKSSTVSVSSSSTGYNWAAVAPADSYTALPPPRAPSPAPPGLAYPRVVQNAYNAIPPIAGPHAANAAVPHPRVPAQTPGPPPSEAPRPIYQAIPINPNRDSLHSKLNQLKVAGFNPSLGLTTVNAQQAETESSKQDQRRAMVARELLSTERSYLDSLTLLFQEGLLPLRKDKIISESDIKTIFSNLEAIVEFHKKLFHDIHEVVLVWNPTSELGSIFNKHHASFKIYQEFVNNFDKSNQLVGKHLSKTSKFKQVQDIMMTKTNKLDFVTLLIMPVQRIPRYVLLLQDLVAKTPEAHPDHQSLKEAISKMEAAASSINLAKKDAEMTARAAVLKKSLQNYPGDLLQDGRRLVKEVEVSFVRAGGFAKCDLTLWSDVIMFLKSKEKKISFLGQLAISKTQLYVTNLEDAKKFSRKVKEAKELASITKFSAFIYIKYLEYDWLVCLKTERDANLLMGEWTKLRDESWDASLRPYISTSQDSTPTPRECVSTCLIGNSAVYIYGGEDKYKFYDDFYFLSLDDGKWQRVTAPSLPGPLAEHTMNTIDNKSIYLFGGFTQSSFSNSMWKFSIDLNKWTLVEAKGPAPTPRAGHTAVVVGTYIYVFGGYSFGSSAMIQTFFNDLHIFDTSTSTWHAVETDTAMIAPRCFHTAALIGTVMYCFGGRGSNGIHLKDLLAFDLNSTTWIPQFEVTGFVPTGRSHAAGMALDELLLIFGGTSADAQFNDMLVFDTNNSLWKSCELPFEMEPRKGHSAVTLVDSLIMFGGRESLPNEVYRYTNEAFLMRDIAKFARRDPMLPSLYEPLRSKVAKLKDYALSVKSVEPALSTLLLQRQNNSQPSIGGVEAGAADIRSCGENSRAVITESNTDVAVRVIQTSTKPPEEVAKWIRDFEFLKRLKNRYLASCYGFAQNEKDVWIVSELCDGGSIRDNMATVAKALSEKQVAFVCSQVLLGLSYLHQLNIVHRNIKAANIMLTPEGQVKLVDPALSSGFDWDLNNSLAWMAPEVSQFKTYSEKSDVYSLGITVMEMVDNSGPPFTMANRTKKYSTELLDFVDQCLIPAASRRPTAAQMVSHPFVAQYLTNYEAGAELMRDLLDQFRRAKSKHQARLTSVDGSRNLNLPHFGGSKSNLKSEVGVTIMDVSRLLDAQRDLLMGEIQKLQAQNAQLTAQVTALTDRVALLEKPSQQ